MLLVDDEPSVLEVTRRYLEQDGEMTVTTAGSAKEAFRLLSAERFDAIVADYQLNTVTGIDLLKAVRGVPPEGTGAVGYDPAFIILTGKSREKVAIDALNYGADYYLRKGRKTGEMLATLKVAIYYGVKKRQTLRGSSSIERARSSGEGMPAVSSASGEEMPMPQGSFNGRRPVTPVPSGGEVPKGADSSGGMATSAFRDTADPDTALISRLTGSRGGSILVSPSGSILFIHPAAAPLLGVDSPEAGIGRQIGDLIPDVAYDLVLLKRLSIGIISNYRLPLSTSRREATITLSRITFRKEEAVLLEFRPDQR